MILFTILGFGVALTVGALVDRFAPERHEIIQEEGL